jgi:hypothetical protein
MDYPIRVIKKTFEVRCVARFLAADERFGTMPKR